MPDGVVKFSMAEILCNALDKDSTEIHVDLQSDGDFYCLRVSDNGSKKLSGADVGFIIDFDNKASSKRGLLRVSRGYLGNALKCIFGYSYALAEAAGVEAPCVIIASGDVEHRIDLKPDRVKGYIDADVVTVKRADDGFTTLALRFPREQVTCDLSELTDLIFATSMVNPERRISYKLLGAEGSLGLDQEEAKPIKHKTSVLWYTQGQFAALFEDFVRARPETQLKEFIPLFRGLTSKKVIREILQKLDAANHDAANHDSGKNGDVQFFPATPLRDLSRGAILKLFAIMRAMSKPISIRSLGKVGKAAFDEVRQDRGWERLRYIMKTAFHMECPNYYHRDDADTCGHPDHVEFPYIVELAVFDRDKDDTDGVKVYQCVNFMASMEDIFSRIFDISRRLGQVGLSDDMPVTVVAHLICPVLRWLNYGKSGLDE